MNNSIMNYMNNSIMNYMNSIIKNVMRRLYLLLVCVPLIACSSTPEDVPTYPESLRTCVNTLVDFKQQVALQQVKDAQVLWSPIYPHLAFDRFSLSLVNELNTPANRRLWLNYVAGKATEQRKIEYQNLPDKQRIDKQALDVCASELAQDSLTDDAFWQTLQRSPPVYPSDYQSWQRVVGIYPVTSLFLKPMIRTEQLRIRLAYEQTAASNAITYAVAPKSEIRAKTPIGPYYPEAPLWMRQAREANDFSWPLLTDEQSSELLRFFAPHWQIETESNDDRPGKVSYDNDGKAWVDTLRPVLYSYSSYTRFQGQILPQFNYVIWFANRPATSGFDLYAGQFDAVQIRLTLDEHGKPYIIDSIHSCGCYHMVLSLNPALIFADRDPDTEPPITLQGGRNMHPEEPITVTLGANDHMVKGMSWQALGEHRSLTLLPYRQLRNLPLQSGNTKSLFDQEGMLEESERSERWFLWPFGVKSPGAMRQVGHHATAFIGERHFDDVDIFESLFLPINSN
jgi:hypothetical protein